MTIAFYIKMTILSMKLLTKEIENKFKKVGSQEEVKDPTVIAKFFHPMSNMTWYATEYNPEDKIFFGYVDSEFGERGYFSLQELEGINIGGLKMERDMYMDPTPFSNIKLRY